MTQYDQPIIDITNYIYHPLDPSSPALSAARTALLDALGCTIQTVSSSAEARKLIGPVVNRTHVPDGFRLPGTGYRLDPVKGAFDMGVLIRYLDYNDALWGREWGHPSDNIGAILSVSDWLSRTAKDNKHTGPPLTIRTLLIAITKAYEIQGLHQLHNAFNAYGIDHVILVKLASAAVTAWLLGLSQTQAMATISHVWMDGHPSRVYRSGSNTIPRKGWAAGDACMRAVHLALLVRAGQVGAGGALSAVPYGFLERTFGARGFVMPQAFGDWAVRNVLFKVMPVEGHGIAAVEAALVQGSRMRERGLRVEEDIVRVEVRATAAADLIINKKGVLRNAADRDHCIQYVIAVALLKGHAPEVGDYADGSYWAQSAAMDSMRERIEVMADEGLTKDYLDLEKRSIGAGLTVYLRDGRVLDEVLVEYPIGHVKNPATGDAVREKFGRNMRVMFSDTEIARIIEAVQVDDLRISDFVDLFARDAPESRL
ncbi:hypothetical protein SI65_04047 [Aspergillus cristatus]|uniref:2-methylcitrate dehydratase n=1 Tax=Aspergillus cristatus TaxID=573508 RepID=A0A1E3BJ70_ASPCR|nr:hypothetical protein SI65_04047 [Aspergillus cristatus]